MIKLLCLTMGIMISMNNCKKEEKTDDVLSIKKVPYTSFELRTDGYYYQNFGSNTIHDISFFYNDGVILNIGGGEQTFTEAEEYIKSQFINNQSYKNSKIGWGVFIIKSNKIFFERWYPSQKPYKAYVREGLILNDTTFIITEFYRIHGGQKTGVESRNETYYFKQFSPKPDSINTFVQ